LEGRQTWRREALDFEMFAKMGTPGGEGISRKS
jgi:hypothetical protein